VGGDQTKRRRSDEGGGRSDGDNEERRDTEEWKNNEERKDSGGTPFSYPPGTAKAINVNGIINPNTRSLGLGRDVSFRAVTLTIS